MAPMTSFCTESVATWWVNTQHLPVYMQQCLPVPPGLPYIHNCFNKTHTVSPRWVWTKLVYVRRVQ